MAATQQEMAIIVTAKNKAKTALRGVSNDLDKVDKSVGGVGAGFNKMKGLAIAGAAAAGAAVVGMAAKSVSAFADFEKSMNEVYTLMPGMSQQAMDEMEGDVKDFSKEFGKLPEEVIPALYQSISAGVPPDNVFEFMETATMASIAGVTDMETAVDGITSAVNSYGSDVLSATQASDMMFTAVKLGKTDFGQLSKAMFQVAPVASGMGVEFSNVTAALAALTAQGVPTKVAAVQLKGAMAELGKEGSIAFKNFEEATGTTFPAFIEAGGTLEEAFMAMKDHADDTNTGVQNMFGSIEAGQSAIALTSESGAPAFKAAMEEMAGSAGATQTAFETMDQGLAATWSKIKANVAVALIDIGDKLAPLVQEWSDAFLRVLPGAIDFLVGAFQKAAGFIQNFVRGAQAIVDWVKNLPGPIKTLVIAIGTIGTALMLLYANPVLAGLAVVAGAVAFIGSKAREAEAKVNEFRVVLEGLEGQTIDSGVVDQIKKIYNTTPKAKRTLDRLGLTFEDLKRGMRRGKDGMKDWIRELVASGGPTDANIHDLKELEKQFGPLADAYEDVADESATANETMRREAAQTNYEINQEMRQAEEAYVQYQESVSLRMQMAGYTMDEHVAGVADSQSEVASTLNQSGIDWQTWEQNLGMSMEETQTTFFETSQGIVNIWDGAADELEITAEEMMENLKESFAQKEEFDTLFKELGDAGMFGLQQALLDGGPGAVGAIREIANSGTMAWEAELRLNPDNALQNLADNLPMYGHWLRVYGSDLARMLESGWNPFLPIPQPGDRPAGKPPPASVAGNPPGAPVDDRPGVFSAAGGIAVRPTVSWVGEGGEPEAIVPLSKADQFGFGSGGSSYSYEINIHLHDVDLSEGSRRTLERIREGLRELDMETL